MPPIRNDLNKYTNANFKIQSSYKKQNFMHDESLHNTSLHKIHNKPNTVDNDSSEEEIDFQSFNIHNKNVTMYSPHNQNLIYLNLNHHH